MKKESWQSEFRKERFYKKQYRKKDEQYYRSFERVKVFQSQKYIAIMLDLDSTMEGIDDEKAETFMRQLDFIRKKFSADYGLISLSTYYQTGKVMNDILEILERNLPNTIKLGMNFSYHGTYDYYEQADTFQYPEFNYDKVETFIQYYNHFSPFISWMAIMDDGISFDTYQKYQNRQAFLFGLPSQKEEDILNHCLMNIGTTTLGFSGVIEILNRYITYIETLPTPKILEIQGQLFSPTYSSFNNKVEIDYNNTSIQMKKKL